MVQPERETTQRDYGLDADREIGQYGVGNIDLYARPKYQYDDGAIATVESMSFNEDGREILVPTIAFDQSGRAVKLTDDQAIRRYHDTGEYLGIFGTPEEATAYAERLHEAQDYYYNRRSEGGGSRTAQLLAKRGIAAGDLSAPANAGSKAALQTLRETGAVTYGGKAYTLPDQIAPEQAEALKRFQAYQALSGAADFEEKSRYQTTANGNEKFNSFAGIYTDTGFNDTLYDFINGNEAAQGHQMVNDTKSNTSHEHLKDLPEATVKTFNYLYATEGPEAAYEYIDFVTDKDYTGIETMALGVLDGTGLASISAAVGAALGTDASKERNREWYSQLKQDAAAAREQHPVMYGAGSVGGTLGLMAGVGGALGAAEGALASGVTIGGQTVALQMSPLVQGVVNGGLTFLAKDAVQNAGAAATGLMSGGDYLKAAGKSGVQGVAGGLAGGLVGSGMAEVLRRTGLMTPFMEFVRQSVTGFASAGANIGTGYALSEEKPSNEQIATDLATAFLFSVLQSGISTYNSTQAAKAQMDAALKEVQSGYSAMSQGWENMTPEARAAQAQNIITQTQSLRNSLNSRYIAGQQSMVNEMNQALDGIEASLQAYVNGFQTASAAAQAPGNLLGGAAAAGAAETKATEELRRQVQEAVEQGLVRAQGGAPEAEWTGPKAYQTSVLPVLGAEAVRKTGQQETIEPERPALPSLAEPQQKQKPQGLPEPSPEPEALTLPKLEEAGNGQKETVPTAGTAGKPRMEMADFTNPESSVWNNVEYGDTETQSAITQTVHKEMLNDGEETGAPEDLSGGDRGRLSDPRAGGETGGPEKGSGRTGGTAEQSRAAAARQNRAKSLRREKISSRELGLESGTDTKSISSVPLDDWDDPMFSTAERIWDETGVETVYVLGSIEVAEGDGQTVRVRGVYEPEKRIVIQADNLRCTIDQIADHEIFHDKAFRTPGLVREIEDRITERYGREEFNRVVDTYIQRLRGVVDLPEDASGEEIGAAYLAVLEEICADAYAGINAFGANAGQYGEVVEEVLEDRGIGRRGRETGEATDRTTGPPRYSYGGRNARGTDSEALAEAERLEMQGLDPEEIRQETGWFRGMDGLWRFEIDDSGMEYSSWGDMNREDQAEYARFRELEKKFIVGSVTEEEQAELRRLIDEGRGPGRAEEQGTLKLSDFIRHDELFRNYPQLRKTGLMFRRLPEGVNGSYSPEHDVISLSEDLRNAPEDTLIHEIQHAIQRAEGFAKGSSPEYWKQRREDITETIRAARENLDLWLNDIGYNEYVKKSISEVVSKQKTIDQHWKDLQAFKDQSKYAKQIARCEEELKEYQQQYDSITHGMTPTEQYLNTAGEIEARDVSARRRYNKRVRRQLAPDLGDEKTVFAEDDAGEYGDGGKIRFSMDEPVEETKDLLAVHNLGEKDLEWALGMGGLPMPSIAVIKAEQGHSKYGPVSIVFNKDTIDPQASRKNRVFGGDAWTQTAPSIEYPVNYEARRALEDRLAELAQNVADGMFSRSSVLASLGLDDVSGMDRAELAKKLSQQEAVKAAYLADQGKTLEPVMKEKPKQYDPFGNDALDLYIEKVGPQRLSQIYEALEAEKRFLDQAELQEVREALKDLWRTKKTFSRPLTEERLEMRAQKVDEYRGTKFVKSAWEYTQGSGEPEWEVDRYATRDAMNELADDETVQTWIEPQLEGILGTPGIRNTKDPFTPAGRSRSFDELHDPYTLEGIVKAMTARQDRGAGIMYVDAKAVSSVATPEYKSVDAIKADSERLQTVDQEAYDAALQELDQKIEDFKADVAGNMYSVQEAVGEALMEGATGTRTDAALKKVFVKYGLGLKPGQAKAAREIYQAAASLPTGYFEAKPERVVRPDEWAMAVVPDDLPADLRQKAEEAGLRITEYKAGDDEDRLRALNSNPGLRFSVDDSEQTEGPATETGGKAERAPTKPEKKAKKPERKKPVAESKPIIAKRDLRKNLLGVFSIPEGQKAELGAVIDSFADRLLREGALTEQDREVFFDRLYSSGVMTMEADEYFQEGRNAVAGGRIFVNDIIKGDFGDDWNAFRKRAMANGVYLTNDQSDAGVDVWNQELGETLPGLFNRDELDGRTILERIVQVAEEGRDQKVSLAEYTKQLAGEEYVSEREILDNMERQMDWALRTFAEKADLEIKLRDRTGVKIAQEREKFAESSRRQREREALRRGKEREQRRDMMRRQRENRELRELQQRTLKQLQWLSKNRYRAPEELRGTWDAVLGDIDIYAVGAANEMNWSKKYEATWRDLAQMYQEAKKSDPNFLPSKDLERIVARLDGDKIADMDVSALQDLYKAAVGLRTEFYNRNNVINDEQGRMFAEVYADSKREIEEAPESYTGKGLDKFVNLEQLTPMNVLERMGGWDPEGTFYSMAKQLEKGERDARAYTVEAKRQIEDFLTENQEWVKRADGQGKDAIWYELEVPELLKLGMGNKPVFGETVKVYMTPAQKVQLYLESKNHDNLRHIAKGGRTFVNRELYSRGERQEAMEKEKPIKLAPETVKKIVSDMTEEEMELARVLERYYNEFAAGKINKVSNAYLGYDKAISKNYVPIFTDDNYNGSEPGIYDLTAEGVGHMKSREGGTNPSYNISALDAFERHIDQTSRWIGLTIPVHNWNTLLKYRDSSGNSMRQVISTKWGGKAKKYIENLLTELQGGKVEEKSGAEKLADTVLSNYISSVFGANPSIVFKQAMSFPLAGTYLGWENVPNIAAALRTDDKLINTYTSELAYRLMGYATPETAQLKDNPSKLSENRFLKFTFGGGAITAMDGWTVKSMWRWAENAVRRENPELETGTQEQIEAGQSPFYQEVARRFEEAVSRSQPMYDVMHRSGAMRNSSGIARALTLFKTVPQQQYNMLRQTAAEASYYKKAYEEGKASKEEYTEAKKRAGWTVLGILLAGLGIEAINFLNAMLKNKGKRYRDEDGDLSWSAAGKQFLQGFASDNVGMMIGGDLAVEILGSVITGDAWYGIEAPGITQIQDILEQFIDTCGNVQKLVKEGYNVVKNGGDLGAYFRRRGADYLGAVEEALSTVATYFGGIAYNNIKSYTLGVLRWLSPKAQTSVEDMMETADKSGLAGLTGEALETRIADILKNRIGSSEEETAEALAALYEAGFKTAVPSDTPGSISVDSESRKLNAFQQQLYDSVWKDTVSGNLDELAASEAFRQADQETRAKMLKALYDYAGELAKAEVFDDYAISSAAEKAETLRTAGGSAADWASWTGASNGMKNEEKFRLLAEIGYSDQVKAGIVGTILGTALETETGEPTQYAKMQSVLDSGLDIDEYLELKADGAVEEYLKGIERGASPEETARAARSVSEIKADAEDDSTKPELCREALKGTQDQDEQLAALSMLMTEGEYARLEVGVAHGITPEQYITAREAIARIDDNQSVSQDEATRAISSMLGLTNAERAVLWQLQNKSWKPKNNPFSASTGERVYQTLQSGEGGTLPRLGAAKGEELQGLSLPKLG